MEEIRVIGHRNPDTDSVCAAICYARLKGRMDPGRRYMPCRAGQLNLETRFVLRAFHADEPVLCTDVRPQLGDGEYRHQAGVAPGLPLRGAMERMRDWDVDTLCVVDGGERLLGLITIRDIGNALLALPEGEGPDPGALAGLLHSPVAEHMTREGLITFTPQTWAESATKVMAAVRHRYFPILDGEGRYLGVMSRRNLLNLRKKQLILVDHNERAQAVEGVAEAEVLEIVDHHRIGAMETDGPVYFRNVPVGCTCTIIEQMYREHGLSPDGDTAGLMLSAILSDTLLFRSPTCTAADERAARTLAELAGVELEPYAEAMFEAGGDVTGKTPAELLGSDYKIFTCGEARFGVGQSSFMSAKARRSAQALVAPWLESARREQELDYVFCMCTDVPGGSTHLLMAGEGAEELVRAAFGVEPEGGAAVLPGVVSRKKQLVPPLLKAIRAREQG